MESGARGTDRTPRSDPAGAGAWSPGAAVADVANAGWRSRTGSEKRAACARRGIYARPGDQFNIDLLCPSRAWPASPGAAAARWPAVLRPPRPARGPLVDLPLA